MDFARQVKSTVDIVEVVRQYVPSLKKMGQRYLGLCPFHQEKSPSFNVHPQQQFFKCFGCGKGGDVFTFLMEHQGVTFPEAVDMLAERYGIPKPVRTPNTPQEDKQTRLRAALFRMHEIAVEAYQQALTTPEAEEVRGYLKRRGLTRELAHTFQLGWSDPRISLAKRFEREGFSAEEMAESGLVLERESGGWFDRFRNRLMFPIHNEAGKVIGFGGRALAADDEPKYLNSKSTPLYDKSRTLYSLNRAKEGIRKQGRVVLVEGYMDVIGVYAAGVTEAVATCGTSLTAEQVKILHRYADRVIVNFDSDNAGTNATERYLPVLLDGGMKVRVLNLPSGKDPDEYVQNHGADAYQEQLKRAKPYFHWLADRARVRFDMKSPEGKLEALEYLMGAVERVPGQLERATIANDLASYLNLDAQDVRQQLQRQRRPVGGPAPRVERRRVSQLEKILLQVVMGSEQTRQAMLPHLIAQNLHDGLEIGPILEAVHALQQEGGVEFAVLESRLGDDARELLHRAMLTDEELDEEQMLEQAVACYRQLEERQRQRAKERLRMAIQVAEREGRLEEALEYANQLKEWDRKAKRA